MIAAGSLRYAVAIRTVAMTRNDAGEMVAGDPTAVTVPADVLELTAAEVIRAGLNVSETNYRVKVRWRADLTAAASLVYAGHTLEIVGIVARGMANREWLEITAVARDGPQ